MVSNDHHSYFAARFVRDETSRINLISVLMYLLLAWPSLRLAHTHTHTQDHFLTRRLKLELCLLFRLNAVQMAEMYEQFN